ncbi:MAG: AAA family ATPase [Alcanivoracaceae bacterium]|nr:AAA family ATPase [Alcanivoracaceae bacterium]
MRIDSIAISNFRQFHGESELLFPYSDSKNVIVIHGDNGSGKTSILNAFKWVLYGTVDFDTGDEGIVNDIALQEAGESGIAKVKVSLKFQHDSYKYYAERSQDFRLFSGKPKPVSTSKVIVTKIAPDGQILDEPNPEIALKFILPNNLQPYFFFNGERIEKLSYSSRSEDIKDAIKNLMGLTIVERAIEHLEKGVKRELSKDTSDFDSQESKDTALELARSEQEREDCIDHIKQLSDNIRHIDSEIEDIDMALKGIEKVAEKQERRLEHEKGIEEKAGKIRNLESQQRSIISSRGFMALGKKSFNSAYEILSSEKKQGRLPAKVRAQLVEDLLASKVCICGRDIKEDSAEYGVVSSLKNDLSDQRLEDAFFEVLSNAKSVDSMSNDFFSELRMIREQISSLNKEKTDLNHKVDALTDELKGINIDNVNNLEDRRKRLKENREYNGGQKAISINSLSGIEKKLSELLTKMKNLQDAEGKVQISQQRINSAKRINEALTRLLSFLTNDVREKLSKQVQETFSSIIRKPYFAEISSSFTLEVYKPLPNGQRTLVTEKSTGESQVCSLSFIASIVSDAKQKHLSGGGTFYRGGIYPLVMDSPFGALDPEYRKLVARYIPKLADQVIILVSESQWRGEVSEQITERIAKSYRLSVQDSGNGMHLSKVVEENLNE